MERSNRVKRHNLKLGIVSITCPVSHFFSPLCSDEVLHLSQPQESPERGLRTVRLQHLKKLYCRIFHCLKGHDELIYF